VLLSINPYKQIPGLYTEANLDEAPSGEGEEDDSDEESEDAPHVYSVAKKALSQMTDKSKSNVRKNQSIVISGESGAGKTEAAKHVMRHLISQSGAKSGGDASDLGDSIQRRIMESNVVLEALGNAKTVRNDNSSRFGKYIKMKYDANEKIIGARTEHFLLEKSRLIRVAKGERNYHIFYQLCAGLDEVLKENYKLGSAKDYKMLYGRQPTRLLSLARSLA
jgi:myosin-5